jgi:hypothetical protein
MLNVQSDASKSHEIGRIFMDAEETLLFVLLILIISFAGCGVNTPGSGEKIGQIVKVSQEGVFVDTWEAQLIRGGLTGGSGAFGTVPFDFTIEDEALVNKVQMYMQNQQEVIIKYRVEGIYSRFRSGSKWYFLVSIEPANK